MESMPDGGRVWLGRWCSSPLRREPPEQKIKQRLHGMARDVTPCTLCAHSSFGWCRALFPFWTWSWQQPVGSGAGLRAIQSESSCFLWHNECVVFLFPGCPSICIGIANISYHTSGIKDFPLHAAVTCTNTDVLLGFCRQPLSPPGLVATSSAQRGELREMSSPVPVADAPPPPEWRILLDSVLEWVLRNYLPLAFLVGER